MGSLGQVVALVATLEVPVSSLIVELSIDEERIELVIGRGVSSRCRLEVFLQ